MKTTSLVMLALAVGVSARADFSYTSTRKASGSGGAAPQVTKYWLKGQKMMVDMGDMVILTDFESQTITRLNRTQKTYSVMKFADMAKSIPSTGDVQADVKETGQKKVINGFNASEVIMNMQMDVSQAQHPMQMQMEMDLWVSPDVPGAQELQDFYKKNADKFPWTAMMQGSNPGMSKAMADLQRKMASLHGVPVLQTIRIKPGGNSAQSAQMQQGMEQARARLEEMAKQGGAQGQAAQQALARMGAAPGGGAMMEMVMESSNFSSSSIPDSTFAVPADYKQAPDKH
jgi:hypothetical protein